MKRYLFVVLVIVMAACGGSESTGGTGAESSDTPATTTPAVQSDSADTPPDTPDTTQAPAEEPAASGGPGGIVLTVGDETWEFPSALCAYYYEEPGKAGSEWNVSFLQDDLQVYIVEDSFGTSVSIADVVNYGDLEWSADNDAVTLSVDGNDITATGTFTDAAHGTPEREGTLTATCASWYEAG